MVTITTAHRGERHLERNIWLNVRYQSYPPSRLELVVVSLRWSILGVLGVCESVFGVWEWVGWFRIVD
eukprot:1169586-Amorphochlora_amoeboformis.AAC.1